MRGCLGNSGQKRGVGVRWGVFQPEKVRGGASAEPLRRSTLLNNGRDSKPDLTFQKQCSGLAWVYGGKGVVGSAGLRLGEAIGTRLTTGFQPSMRIG